MIDFLAFLFSLSAVKAVWFPAAIAGGLVLFAPSSRHAVSSAMAVTAALWIGLLLSRPMPAFPPIGGIGWMLYASLAGLILGLLARNPRRRLAANLAFTLGLPTAVTVLVGQAAYASVLGAPAWAAFGLLSAAGIVLCARLVQRGDSPEMPKALFVAACGLAALGWLYGTRLSLHAMTLAAALAGTSLAVRIAGRSISPALSYAGGAAYFALAATMIFWSDSFILPVTATFLVFFAPDIAESLWPKPSPARNRLATLLAVLFAAGAPLAYLYGV